MNRLLLFLILLPRWIWQKMGADILQLKAILKIKLMLDDRRPLSMSKLPSDKKKPLRFMSLLSAFFSALIGFAYILPLFLDDNIMGYWLYFSVFLAMLSFMLISDFSTVLFDARDQSIIAPRPVSERTIILSRMLHMTLYLVRVVLPMSLAGWIFTLIDKGALAAAWFFLMVLMLTILALFLVNATYLLILKLAKPERFKDVINYFQIGFSMLMFAFIYLMPRAIDSEGFQQLKHADFSWALFTPSYWLAASFSWVVADTQSALTPWIGILAIVNPLLLMWFTVKYLTPSFALKVAQIDRVSVEQNADKPTDKNQTVHKSAVPPLYHRLAKKFTHNAQEYAGFALAWLQTGRSRSFKMRVFPSYGFVPVYFFYLITMNHSASIQDTWEQLPNTKTFVLLLYMTSFIVMNLLTMVVHSEQYKASWIYEASPVQKPGSIMAGAFKAVWIKYFLPVFLLISAFVLYVWGWTKVTDVFLALVNITVFALGILRVAYRKLPFSTMELMKERKNRFFKTMFIMMLPAGLGFGHYWTCITPWLWWLKWVFIGLSFILLWLLWDSYKNTSWEDLQKQ